MKRAHPARDAHEFLIRPHQSEPRYGGRPTRRTISANLGSERIGSHAQKIFRDCMELSRSANAFSSQAKARSLSPKTPYMYTMKHRATYRCFAADSPALAHSRIAPG